MPALLEKIEISTNGYSPLSGLTNLEKLTFRGNKLNNNYFKIDGNCLITKGSNEDYSDGKMIFGFNDVIIPNYINTLPDNLFRENYSITSLTLHKNITSVGTSSLKNMRNSYGYGAIKAFNYPGTLNEFKTKISNNTSFYDLLKQTVYSDVILNYKDENGKDVSIKMNNLI